MATRINKYSNRGITGITYDYGHHPYYIDMNQGRGKSKNITYDYTPDGVKLSSRHVMSIQNEYGNTRKTTTDLYIDGLILRDGKPLMWLFDGGYVDLDDNGSPTGWNYYVTDHLGSTRMVVGSDNTVRETINYYPFGSEMRMQDPAQMTNEFEHPYRFTDKELDRLNGLNMYDFGARWYDVAGVPMWTSVDPLAEKYYNVSPYVYCNNNPVMFIDPDGRASGDYYNTSGKQIGTDGLDDDKKYMVLDSYEQELVKAQGTVEHDKLSSAIPIPSNDVINTADKALKQSETNEHGFVVATDGTTSNIILGTSSSVKLGPGYQELEGNGKQTSYDVHTHPFEYAVTQNGECNYTNSEPSPADLSYRAMKEENNAVTQPSWIIGKAPLNYPANGSPQTIVNITFYKSSGPISTMSWKSFKKAVNRINK